MKIVHCKDCPASFTPEGEIASNYGCLPGLSDMLKLHEESGRLWACHAKQDKVCGGLLERLIKTGKTVDFSKPLIKENEW